MHPKPWFVPAAACITLARLLWAERTHHRIGIYVFKPLTSSAFIAYAIVCGALKSDYGHAILLAQGLCFVGDVLLMLPGPMPFLAGLGSFLLGHAGYALALAGRITQPAWGVALAFAAGMLGVSARIHHWLAPHVPSNMLWPVRGYILMITVMTLAAAAQTPWPQGPFYAVLGAVLFYLSDICVAKERFVAAKPWHTLVGLPLYYTGQMLLAASVANAPT